MKLTTSNASNSILIRHSVPFNYLYYQCYYDCYQSCPKHSVPKMSRNIFWCNAAKLVRICHWFSPLVVIYCM